MIFIAAKSTRILTLLVLLSSVFIMGCQTTDESNNQDSSRILRRMIWEH
jgi:hypothetical protein